jgi:alkyldihydroxyacetonephosphate synthase
MTKQVKQMKWWGWGSDDVEFSVENRPKIVPFILDAAGLKNFEVSAPVALESIHLNPANLKPEFMQEVAQFLRVDQITSTHIERVVHAYGKSLRDLWRIRRGQVDSAPDCIIYPENSDQVKQVVLAAARHNIVLIPFGGGSNIAGCLESKDQLGRMVVSLDMKRMNKLVSIDAESNMAVIQAGVLGPHLEQQLQQRGFTLGHFPDSFEFSSLGGWVATRSAGMMSDRYGKIEDMVIAITMVSPCGEISTIKVPKASDGIDIKHMLIGSEGILGVITAVTMQVHRLPEKQTYVGYLFPDFDSGVAAMRECAARNFIPAMTRLSDPGKTQLSFAFKKQGSPLKQKISRAMTWYISKVKKFDLQESCIMLNIFEGDQQDHARLRKGVTKIYKKHGAVSLGKSPGESFSAAKFDFPYIRDYLLDRNIFGDVSETSTSWSNLLPLYNKVMESVNASMLKYGTLGFRGCHISHTYHTGASLYFTFAVVENQERGLQHYLAIKKSLEDAFMQHGGTLSHHHAVGYEHLPWVERDISAVGVGAVTALKNQFDPRGIMNPGKIIPGNDVWSDWGWQEKEGQPELDSKLEETV